MAIFSNNFIFTPEQEPWNPKSPKQRITVAHEAATQSLYVSLILPASFSCSQRSRKAAYIFFWAIYIFIQVFWCETRNAKFIPRLAFFKATVLIHGPALLVCCLYPLCSLCPKHLLQGPKIAPYAFSYSSLLLHSSSFSLCIYTFIVIDPVIFYISFTVNTSIMQLWQLCIFITNSCTSPQQWLHCAICAYKNSVVMDFSKNSVAAHSGPHFLSLNWFSAPEEIIFFAKLEAKTLLVLQCFLLSSEMACCYCPDGSLRWEPGLRHQLFKQVERLSLISASGAHNRKMEQAGNWFPIKEASFSLAQLHVQPPVNIYCSHRS